MVTKVAGPVAFGSVLGADVPPSSGRMMAAHVLDTLGAQTAGFSAALITRPGNAVLPVVGLPQPNFFAPDLPALAAKLPAPKAV